MMSPTLTIQVVRYADAQAAIQSVRYQVFQVEQQVSAELEFDGNDDTAVHLIAYLDDRPVGTLRMRELGDRQFKIERVAVLSSHRGQGIGRQLMNVAIARLRQQGAIAIKVNSQTQASPFYEKLGFQGRGEEFHEAGIPHREMWLSLESSPLTV